MASEIKRLLLLGGGGQVGLALRNAVWPEALQLHAPTREELDINDAASTAKILSSKRYSAVINAAAYTSVDNAENEVSAALAANSLAPAVLAEVSRSLGIPMLHFSTDYVFDGASDRPYLETDPVNPLGVYGLSKLAGERAVLAAHSGAIVLRTAWVVSPYRSNFLKTMLRLAQDRAVVRVVADQRGCPTSAADIADTTIKLVSRLVADPPGQGGLYHFVNDGHTSWAGLAREIFAASALSGGPTATVEDIATSDYPTLASRPANSQLSTTKIATDFEIRPRPWQAAVGNIVADILKGQTA